MHRYMKRSPKPYMHIIRANVDSDFETLVKTRPVGQWRETLALLATYTAQVCVRCVDCPCSLPCGPLAGRSGGGGRSGRAGLVTSGH